MQTLIFTPSGPGHEFRIQVAGPSKVEHDGSGQPIRTPQYFEAKEAGEYEIEEGIAAMLLKNYPDNFKVPEGKKAENGPPANKAEPPPGKNKRGIFRRKAGD